MNILLDTHAFLWLASNDSRLTEAGKALILDQQNNLFLSAISVWEISVKHQIGKLKLKRPPSEFIPQAREDLGVQELPLQEAACLFLPQLPEIHKDPFDRMLMCQAIEHGLVLFTDSAEMKKYPVKTVW
jgi:PIN domain nuclease of toxin-antitoxin system